MLTFLHSVILADQATAGLLLEKLHGSRFEMTWERVESEEAYLGCLDARVDLIIADYRYARVGVFRALQLVREANLDIPVIVVSDGIGDEAVAECMRRGAADCLLKTHLERLEGAVASAARQRHLRQTAARAEAVLRKREQHFRMASEVGTDYAYSFRIEADGTVIREWITGAFTQMTGFTADEAEERGGGISLVHPEDVVVALRRMQTLLSGHPDVSEYRIRTKSGAVRWVRDHGRAEWDETQGRVVRIFGAARDITDRKLAEEALRNSEKRFRALIEKSADGIALIDDAGGIVYLSPAMHHILGYTEEELVGRNAFDFMHPDEAQFNADRFAELLQHPGTSAGAHYRYRHKDGSWRWLESVGTNLLTDPSVQAVVINYRDVTDRKQAEAALAAALRERENIMETIPDVLYTLDLDGHLITWNQQLERVSGRASEEISGRSAVEFVREEERLRVGDAIRLAFARGYAEVEANMLHKDGGVVPYHFNCVPLRDDHGTVIGLTGVGRDIAERKRAEAELERLTGQVEQQARTLEGILSASSDHIHMFDRDGRFTYTSLAGARALGRTQADVVGKTSRDLGFPDQTVALAAAQREAVFATGKSISGESHLPTVNGWRDFDYTLNPILRADGSVEAVVATASDVTERKRAEQRTAVLLEVARDISGTHDLSAIFARVLRRAAEALPCDGAAVFHLDPARDVTRMIAHHGIPPELCALADALEFPRERPFGGRLKRGETVVINDITQQSWLPADFCARFRIAALVAAPLNVRGRGLGALVAFNTAAGQHFDSNQVDLFNGVAGQLAVAMESAALHRAQEEEAEVSAALAQVGRDMIALVDTPVLLNRICQLTTEVLQCDYSHIWLWQPEEHAYVAASAHGDPPEHWEALRTVKLSRDMIGLLLQRLESNGLENIRMSGLESEPLANLPSQYGITVGMIAALRRGGEIVGLYTAGYRGRQDLFSPQQERIARGIAQLGSLALESARLVEELQRANRLKSEFVATMSHELRTPLNIITGYNEILLDGAFGTLNSEQTDVLRRIDHSAKVLLELINATLDMSRLESGRVELQRSEVNLPELIREIDTETRELPDKKPGVRFAWEIESPLPQLVTDAIKLKVILKNLINNATKFTEQGSVVVHVRPHREGIEFNVTDTGIGITTDEQLLIFEPFRQVDSSSTRRYGGVGLGLSIARRLGELLGGTVSVESKRGCGSTFRVWLPSGGAALPGQRKDPLSVVGNATSKHARRGRGHRAHGRGR